MLSPTRPERHNEKPTEGKTKGPGERSTKERTRAATTHGLRRFSRRMLLGAALIASPLLAGGGCFFAFGTGGVSVSVGDGNNPTPITPCFQDSCADKVTIASIGDAENLIFSSTGRLFVSGGQNLFEITRNSAGDYVSTVVSTASCNFTGLAIIQTTLFAACFDGSLWAGSLTQTPIRVGRITGIAGITAGNGLVDGPDGASLYLVNGPSGNQPKIVRIQLNANQLTQVLSASDWLTTGLSAPNGLQRKGSLLYVSDSDTSTLGLIKTVPILSNGNPGSLSTVASFNSLPDDFTFIGNDIAAAFFSSGQIARINLGTGSQTPTGLNSFANPSQVRLSRGPLFRDGDLLVTEKGVIGDNTSTVGNVLTLYRTK